MADEQFYTILTNIGKAKIANAGMLGKSVVLEKIQAGDGGGNYYNPTEDQTALKNKVWEGNINAFDNDENNPNWIIATACIPGSIGGFTVREMGLIDNEGDMIAVCKSPETYKPKVDNGAMKDLYLKFIIEVSNVEKVTLVVDPTAIFLTKKDEEKILSNINKLDTKIDTTKTELTNNIETAKTELNNKIGDTKQLTTTDKTNIVSAVNEVKTSVDSIETTAEKTSIKDTDNLFESDNVEEALNQLARNYNTLLEKQNNLETEVNGQRIKGISIANSLIDMI
ncbi:phage tail protein [Clostridioides difficile]|uniref:phage tail protein n=1 Tax=Clostridioides difficile TaxID=1496 RepID=UPI00038CBEAA|nr:phage tail protein [Clostridioides difficile]EQG78630.1 phage tail-collar fiber family protein [Clostridioides difficile DA00165]EJA6671083.1 phage tail protein [Clostridioides difficile]EJA6812366.1 phage tail protein [Clostridioides difficile]EJX3380707.1 phage tail protein [Clostridioides difficile]ELX4569468.1 phage tail protein [Clostridioides difficile]